MPLALNRKRKRLLIMRTGYRKDRAEYMGSVGTGKQQRSGPRANSTTKFSRCLLLAYSPFKVAIQGANPCLPNKFTIQELIQYANQTQPIVSALLCIMG